MNNLVGLVSTDVLDWSLARLHLKRFCEFLGNLRDDGSRPQQTNRVTKVRGNEQASK